MDNKVKLDDDLLDNVWGGSKIPYIVKTGDTVGAIADKFHCNIDDICRWNHLLDPNKIWKDQILTLKF